MKKIITNIALIIEIFLTSHKLDKKITLYEFLHGLCINMSKVVNVIMPAYIVNLIVSHQTWSLILSAALLYGAAQCIFGFGEKSFKLLQEAHGFRACNLLRLSMNQKFMRVNYADTENSKVMDAFEEAKDSMWEFTDVGYVIFDDILGNLITFLCMSYILFEINIFVYFIVLLFVSCSIWIQYKKDKYIHESELKEKVIHKWLDYISKLMQDYKVGKEIRLYELQPYMQEKYNEYSDKYRKQINKREQMKVSLSVVQSGMYFGQIMLVYLTAVERFILGKLQIGSFLLYISSINELSSSIRNLLEACIELSKVSFYYKDYLNFMNIPEEIRLSGKEHVELKDGNEIEFRNVSYYYPDSNRPAIDRISFSFGGVDKIGVVGENGSGKSTFVKLLLRLYDPTEGEIYLNGKDIRLYQYEEYLNIFKTVFQDFSVLSYSILENITFDPCANQEKLMEVLKITGLQDSIQKYKNGINSMVTKTLSDDGVHLSGGESQLLAISRTFYHDSKIVVFDEPTAALDPIREASIFELIKEMSIHRSALFCAHRMSSTKFCDKIIVFENGKIIETGTHHELLEWKGAYYNMFLKQASLYQTDAFKSANK